jgi:hypothetical protein
LLAASASPLYTAPPVPSSYIVNALVGPTDGAHAVVVSQ